MIFKLLGAAALVICGGLYAKHSQKHINDEVKEAERLICIFVYLKNEIEEFDTPLVEALKEKGICGGVDGLLASCTGRLYDAVKESEKLGRGYKSEELRICARVIDRLENERKILVKKAEEAAVLSRVKGYGIAAALIILLI